MRGSWRILIVNLLTRSKASLLVVFTLLDLLVRTQQHYQEQHQKQQQQYIQGQNKQGQNIQGHDEVHVCAVSRVVASIALSCKIHCDRAYTPVAWCKILNHAHVPPLHPSQSNHQGMHRVMWRVGDIVAAEHSILHALDWNMYPKTSRPHDPHHVMALPFGFVQNQSPCLTLHTLFAQGIRGVDIHTVWYAMVNQAKWKARMDVVAYFHHCKPISPSPPPCLSSSTTDTPKTVLPPVSQLLAACPLPSPVHSSSILSQRLPSRLVLRDTPETMDPDSPLSTMSVPHPSTSYPSLPLDTPLVYSKKRAFPHHISAMGQEQGHKRARR